ncbi:MAG: large-conductance mechanosensitive channel protein MscL [Roseburia sp.]|nr:large-conductance mechanosensitive channel protein MscL [Roseburia sp.]
MGKFLSDFKEFAMKGNVVDMAVGVIVGGAFGKIVSSLVNDILMPLISVITGGSNFTSLKYVITSAQTAGVDGAVADVAEVAVNYGMFIQNIVDFLIIAFSIFVALRVIMKFKKKEEEVPAAPAAPTQEELLTDIRDLLRKDLESKK